MIDLGLDIYRSIGLEADRMGIDAYAVGGVVRDYFLRDFMPRVKVTIDGEAAPPPLLANGAFPAVPVPGGRHVVGLSPDVPARATILPMLGAAIFVLLLGLWARDEMLEGRS